MAKQLSVKNVPILLIAEDERLAAALVTAMEEANFFAPPTVQLHHVPTLDAARDLVSAAPPALILVATDVAGIVAATRRALPGYPLVLVSNNAQVANRHGVVDPLDVFTPAELDGRELARLARYAHSFAAQPALQRGLLAFNGAAADAEPLLTDLLSAAQGLSDAALATIMLIHDDQAVLGYHFPPRAAIGDALSEQLRQRSLPLAQIPSLQHVASRQEPLSIPDTAAYAGWRTHISEQTIGSWLGVPVTLRDSLLGILTVDHPEPHHFRPELVPALQALAAQCALALQNAALQAERQHQQGELEVLNQLSAIAAAARDEDELFGAVTDLLGRTLATDDFGFLLLDPRLQIVRTHASYHTVDPDRRVFALETSAGVIGRTVRSNQPQRVGDARRDPDFVSHGKGRLSELCVPLQVNGELIGVINAESARLNAFSWSDEQLLVIMANHISTALNGLRLRAAERRRLLGAEALQQAAMSLTQSLNLDTVLDNVLEQLSRVIPYDCAVVFLHHDGALAPAAMRGLAGPDAAAHALAAGPPALLARIAETRLPLVLSDAQTDAHFLPHGAGSLIRAWIGAPLVARGGVIGFLSIASRQIAAYDESDAFRAQGLANHATLAIENARLYETAQEARQRADRLRQAAQSLHHSLDSKGLSDTVLEALEALVPYDSASLLMIDDAGKLAVVCGRGYENWTSASVESIRFDLGRQSLLTRIISGKTSMLIAETRQVPDWEWREETVHVRNWIGVPLLMQGVCVGCLSADKAQPGFFNEEHLRSMEILATQAAAALQNAELFAAMRRSADGLHLAAEILRALNASPDVAATLPEAFSRLQSLGRCDWITLVAVNEHGGTIGDVVYGQGPAGAPLSPAVSLPLPEADPQATGVSLDVQFIADYADSPGNGSGGEGSIRSSMHLPLQAARLTGLLNMYWARPRAYEQIQLQIIQQVTGALALALERSQLFAQVGQRARELAQLNRLARRLTGSLNSAVLAKSAADTLHDGFGIGAVFVLLADSVHQLAAAGAGRRYPPGRPCRNGPLAERTGGLGWGAPCLGD